MLAGMKHWLILAAFGAGLAAWGQDVSAVGTKAPEGAASVEVLWPAGKVPGAVGTTFDDVPKLWCYPAAGLGPHTAVVVLPGGGYNHLVTGGEGAIEAKWLKEHGVSAYVLQYRLSPRYLYPWAMVDGERAVRFVRAHAKAWGLKPDAVGVWGFSAGGHLAGYLATAEPHRDPRLPMTGTMDGQDYVDKESGRPDFAIINYGRLTIDRAIPGTFGMESITGPNASAELIEAISPVKHVTKETSPSFLYATEFDEKVNSLNATAFFDALQRAGVKAELHVFEQGPHGTHMGTDQPKYPELGVYPVLLEHWMQVHGWM
jgi:acetyl esterase/lipase